jgi:hypothetical protein
MIDSNLAFTVVTFAVALTLVLLGGFLLNDDRYATNVSLVCGGLLVAVAFVLRLPSVDSSRTAANACDVRIN